MRPIELPAIPYAAQFQGTLANGQDGLLATILDLCGHVSRLGQSLLQQSSTAGPAHDSLEQATAAQDGMMGAIESRPTSDEAMINGHGGILTEGRGRSEGPS